MATGWTPTYIETSLTLPDVEALHAEWEEHPPLPHVVAALAGVKSGTRSAVSAAEAPPVVLDPTEFIWNETEPPFEALRAMGMRPVGE